MSRPCNLQMFAQTRVREWGGCRRRRGWWRRKGEI